MKVKCDYENCGEYLEKKSLKRHKLIKHTNNLQFPCEECEKKFAVKDSLDQHYKTVHLKVKVVCKDCGLEFSSPSLRKRHVDRGKQNHKFKCSQCCATYKQETWLSAHVSREHTEKNTRLDTSLAMDSSRRQTSSSSASAAATPVGRRNSTNLSNNQPGPSTKRKNTTNDHARQKKIAYCKDNTENQSEEDVTVVLPSQYPEEPIPDIEDETDENILQPESPSDESSIRILGQNEPPSDGKEDQDNAQDEEEGGDYVGDVELFPPTQANCNQVMKDVTTQDNATFPQLEDYRYDPYFLLHIWGFVQDRKYFEDFVNQTYMQDKVILDKILHFFGGTMAIQDNSELIRFLEGNPQSYIGSFAVACIIVDYCFEKEASTVMELFMEAGERWEVIIKTTVRYMVQRGMREGTINGPEILEEIRENINYGFLSIISTNNKDIQTNYENSIVSELNAQLIEMLFSDIRKSDICLLDGAYDTLSRAEKWTKIAEIVVSSRNHLPRRKIIDEILMSNLRRREQTLEYFKIKCGNSFEPIHFHKEVVSRYGNPEPSVETVIQATSDDVSVLADLMYYDYNAMDFSGKITVGVYKLAKQLKVENLWWLLFRDKTLEEIAQTTNKKDLIQIMICTRMHNYVNEVAKEFHRDPERLHLLSGLDVPNLEYFLLNESLQITKFERYEILVSWSYASCGKTFTSVSNVTFDKNVGRYLDLVRHLVNINDLVEKWELIAKHGFMVTEILDARKLRMQNNDK